MVEVRANSFIHSEYFYSASSRNLLRGVLSPVTENIYMYVMHLIQPMTAF